MNLVLRRTVKAVGEHRIKWGRKTFLDLDYADDFRQIIFAEGRILE